MVFSTVVRDYMRWHYGAAFHELFHVWLNFLWFIIHLFSIPQLLRAWIAPWKRITEERRGFSFESWAAYFIINALSRFIGFLFRGSVIAVGLVSLFITTVAGLITYLLWFVAPVISVALFAVGLGMIVTNTLL